MSGRVFAGARALYRAAGVSGDDMGKKPIIAIANSFDEFLPGHVHLNKVGRIVSEAIKEAGGIPREFNTMAVDDGIAMGHVGMKYSLVTRDLIAEIEGGIKREVSVGCAVERAVCSICGGDLRAGDCGHRKGQEYGGRLCFASLEGASGAYEFSFVAVPAQPLAGVVKSAGSWREMALACPGGARELKKLEEEYRLPLENMEKRQALLENLFRNLTGDSVLMGDWNRGSWNGEKDQLKRLLEQSRSIAEADLELFSGAYQTLVKFLEEGGF